MEKARKCFLFMMVMSCFAFAVHKFYTAIYQVNFVPKKQMVQVTARIFNDDLNEALENKFKAKIFLGTNEERPQDLVFLKKYLAEKFTIKINGKPKPMTFVSHEVEDNVLICYLKCVEVSKITTMEIQNSIITEIHG